jgi:subtilisin family serine protease
MRTTLPLVAAVIALTSSLTGLPTTSTAQTEPAQRMSAAVQSAIERTPTSGTVRVIVRFRSTLPADAAPAAVGRRDALAQRQVQIDRLRQDAQLSQAATLSWLQQTGEAQVRPFWIFNGAAVQAPPDIVEALAARPEVASVTLDEYRKWVNFESQPVRPDPLRQALAVTPARTSPPPEPGAFTWGVRQIQADQVTRGVGVDGNGVVVGVIDTGVDWTHPALRDSYRGSANGIAPDHLHNWFDATDEGAVYPSDQYGHGTHVAGTIAGANGIGVAPGAKWIAAKGLDGDGSGFISWLHAALEWMLAPGGDPSRAPDIVSNSWGNNNGRDTEFREDIQALQRAGILVIFAAGNAGPNAGTVGSPGSLPEVLTVGATDENDTVAGFSSRGPSPLEDRIKPDISAPGVRVISTVPGGAYAAYNGTSMATPHVAGAAALLLSVRPDLSITETVRVLTETARPLSSTLPNNLTGWGRVNAFDAVMSVLDEGLLDGFVLDGGTPVVGAEVIAREQGTGRELRQIANAAGGFAFRTPPGIYTLFARAFGYQPGNSGTRLVGVGQRVSMDVQIREAPSGSVRGTVRDATSGAFVTATVTALSTPRRSLSNNSCVPCRYGLDLPTGTYVIEARALGYRVVSNTVEIRDGVLTDLNFELPRAPKVAHVDTGSWYFASAASFYREAFGEMRLTVDEFIVRNPPQDTPTITTLLKYDAVVWSAPFDAPSVVGASETISAYLASGKHLILSGQDVAYFDGGGIDLQPYFVDRLGVRLKDDESFAPRVNGIDGGPFDRLQFTIEAGQGANNQLHSDIITPTRPELASPIASYLRAGNVLTAAATMSAPCNRYRGVVFGFGLEAIDDVGQRADVIERSLAALDIPRPATGVELLRWPVSSPDPRIGNAAQEISQTFRVRHTGPTGVTQTFQLELNDSLWPTRLSQTRVTLAPCATTLVTLTTRIAEDAGLGVSELFTLTVRAEDNASINAQRVLQVKTPAAVLLVDDDRWINYENDYLEALTARGVAVDRWETNGDTHLGASPPITLLRAYPAVIWFNGYDWFDPVSPADEQLIMSYLDGGGKLLLTSQAATSYIENSILARQYFGVAQIDYNDVTSNVVGMPGTALGGELPGGSSLPFPWTLNLSTAVQPTAGTDVFLRGDSLQPFGLLRRGINWRSAFVPMGFETLPRASRDVLLDRLTGWLSPLGDTRFEATLDPDGRAATLVMRIQADANARHMRDGETLSVQLTPGPGLQLASGASTESLAVRAGAVLTRSWRVDLTASGPLTASVALRLSGYQLGFSRDVTLRPNAAPVTHALRAGVANWGSNAPLTYTLTLTDGPARPFTATLVLPPDLRLVRNSAMLTGSGVISSTAHGLQLRGMVAPGQPIQLVLSARTPLLRRASSAAYFPTVVLDLGDGRLLPISVELTPFAPRHYFPIIRR